MIENLGEFITNSSAYYFRRFPHHLPLPNEGKPVSISTNQFMTIIEGFIKELEAFKKLLDEKKNQDSYIGYSQSSRLLIKIANLFRYGTKLLKTKDIGRIELEQNGNYIINQEEIHLISEAFTKQLNLFLPLLFDYTDESLASFIKLGEDLFPKTNQNSFREYLLKTTGINLDEGGNLEILDKEDFLTSKSAVFPLVTLAEEFIAKEGEGEIILEETTRAYLQRIFGPYKEMITELVALATLAHTPNHDQLALNSKANNFLSTYDPDNTYRTKGSDLREQVWFVAAAYASDKRPSIFGDLLERDINEMIVWLRELIANRFVGENVFQGALEGMRK